MANNQNFTDSLKILKKKCCLSSAYTIHSKSTLRLQNLLKNWKYSTVTISMVWLLRGLNRHFYNDERWSETNFCREFSSQHTIKVLPSAYFSSIETFRIEYLHMSLTPITSKRWSQKRRHERSKKTCLHEKRLSKTAKLASKLVSRVRIRNDDKFLSKLLTTSCS